MVDGALDRLVARRHGGVALMYVCCESLCEGGIIRSAGEEDAAIEDDQEGGTGRT
jgi:hypothetical protein